MRRAHFAPLCLAFASVGCPGPDGAPKAPDAAASHPPASPAPAPSPDCPSEAPLGTRAEMTTPVGAATGPRVDEPVFCDRGNLGPSPKGAYIRVHGSGTRRIAMGPPSGTGACTKAPASDAPPAACPLVAAHAVGDEVAAALKARGIEVNGIGMGVCGAAPHVADVDAWHYSIGVTRWRDVDAAIRVVDDVLRRWGVGHHFGVSVRGIDCLVPTPR